MAFLAGETLTADRLNAELGLVWTEYTPTWTTSGTQPSIGNGYLKGEWNRIGDLVRVRITMQAGTTTTFGTNAWSFGLPVTAGYDPAVPWPIWNGSLSMRDVSVSAYDTGTAVLNANGEGVVGLVGGVLVSSNSPFAWSNVATSGLFDNLSLNVDYRAA